MILWTFHSNYGLEVIEVHFGGLCPLLAGFRWIPKFSSWGCAGQRWGPHQPRQTAVHWPMEGSDTPQMGGLSTAAAQQHSGRISLVHFHGGGGIESPVPMFPLLEGF